MKRTVILLLTMTAAAIAQTPTVTEKPATKPSAATVKVSQASATAAKPAPATVKVNAPVARPATVSVQAAPAKVAAKPATVASTPAKSNSTASVKPATSAPATVSVKPANGNARPAVVPAKPVVAASGTPNTVQAKTVQAKTSVAPAAATKTVPAKAVAKNAKSTAKTGTTVAVQDTKSASSEKKESSRPVTAAGRRDPFVSPVVALGAVGSGCSTGKRCLAIDQIALRGVVKSDAGMIAVVVNAMDKAYFLRENDPVFNGYVVKITGDSIIFKESFKDRLGKSLTRDVTKTISRPVA